MTRHEAIGNWMINSRKVWRATGFAGFLFMVMGTLSGVMAEEAVAQPGADSASGFVYSSFTGDGEDGLHLLTSMDGKTWNPVRNYASIYQQSEGLMRDPSICLGGDGRFHMVWTTGWWDDTIGIAHSDDLLHWTPSRKLYIWADYQGDGDEESDGTNWPTDLTQPAERNRLVRNSWAPEIFYDDRTEEYVIFWATTIDNPEVFPETWDARRWERMNQRMYYITTKDFQTYTPRKFFYAPADRVVIDAAITRVGPRDYRMVIKDEVAQSLHVCFPTQELDTWAEMPRDYWGPMSEPFTGPRVRPDNTNAEGPSVVQVGDEWFIYCDYWRARRNGLFATRDFKDFTRLNDELDVPFWVRHGTVIEVPATVIESLHEEDFTPIFNGRDLNGWEGRPGWWEVRDGVIVCESTADKPSPTHYLYWRGGTPADFDLRAQYRITGAGGNSGIHIRSQARPDFDIYGYQADFDTNHAYTGCLYEHARGLIARRGERVHIDADGQRTVTRFASEAELRKAFHDNDWNEYRILAKGPRISLWINGVLMCEVEDHQEDHAQLEGHIALQMHEGPPMRVEFKNIRIKEL